MNKKLSVGMWVRTDKGIIFKTNQAMLDNPMTFLAANKINLYDKDNKASLDKIDLIENEDIVTIEFTNEFKKTVKKRAFVKVYHDPNMINFETIDKERICYFKKENKFVYINSGGDIRPHQQNIQFKVVSIVTHQQFKANEYVFEEE